MRSNNKGSISKRTTANRLPKFSESSKSMIFSASITHFSLDNNNELFKFNQKTIKNWMI